MARLPRDPRRVPLRPDPTAIRDNAMTSLTRSALSIALSEIEPLARFPTEYCKKTWPRDRDAALLTRGIVFPANTADAVALTTAALAFLSSLTPLSAGADLLGRALSVQFGRVAEVHMPGFGLPDADFVLEGMPIPVQQPPPSPGAVLTRCKLAIIFDATRELLTAASAEQFLQQLLIESTAPAVDRVLLSVDPAGPDRPAGLRFGVTPLTPTGGDIVDDLVAIVAQVAPVAGNAQVAIVAAPAEAAAISLRLPRAPPYPVLASTALPVGAIIAIALPALVSAVETPSIEARRDAVVHEHSDQPAQIISETGIVARPVRSMFQTDTISMRLVWQISWGLRDPRAIAWMTR